MLRSTARAKTPELQLLVDEMVNEETRIIMRERRDAARIPMTRAVKVTPCDERECFTAISRDISNLGIGMVSQDRWERGRMARLEIDRIERKSVIVMAECKWCVQVTEGWFLSGWYFMNVERG